MVGFCRLHTDNWLQIVGGLILPVLALILAAILCGCSQDAVHEAADPEPVPRRGGTLRFLCGRVDSLDPVISRGDHETAVLAQIYEGLVSLDGESGLRPCLAESWVITGDGRTCTLILRRDVAFHDGRPLDAQAVVQSLQRAVRHAPEAYTHLRLIEGVDEFVHGTRGRISGLEVAGPDTVRVRLTEADSGFLHALAMIQLGITAQPEGISNPNRTLAGTGPFRFVRRTSGGDIHVARNEEYWGARAYLDSLHFTSDAGLSSGEKVSRMLTREAHIMAGNAWEAEMLGDKAGYRLLRSADPHAASEAQPSPCATALIVDPGLRGLEDLSGGFHSPRFDKVWFAGGDGPARRQFHGSGQ